MDRIYSACDLFVSRISAKAMWMDLDRIVRIDSICDWNISTECLISI